MNRVQIPHSIISVIANLVSEYETHATLDRLFMYAGAPGEPPAESKKAKALAWLRRTNNELTINPIDVLGKILESYFEEIPEDPENPWWIEKSKRLDTIREELSQKGFKYIEGGMITSGPSLPSKSLEQQIRDRDIRSINFEFERAIENIESTPREAVSAACNILESTFKVFIEDEKLDMPAKQDIYPVWALIRDNLGFDPKNVEDDDLKKILSGLASIVSGIGALRTHASTAHGSGRTPYKIESRHARLAVNAAHTLVLFILESWDKKRYE